MVTFRRVRRSGSMVVSHNSSGFISPRPLNRLTSTPLRPSRNSSASSIPDPATSMGSGDSASTSSQAYRVGNRSPETVSSWTRPQSKMSTPSSSKMANWDSNSRFSCSSRTTASTEAPTLATTASASSVLQQSCSPPGNDGCATRWVGN